MYKIRKHLKYHYKTQGGNFVRSRNCLINRHNYCLLPLGGKMLPRYIETEDVGIKVVEHLSRESQGCYLVCLSR